MKTLTLALITAVSLTALQTAHAQDTQQVNLVLKNSTSQPAEFVWLKDNTPQGRKSYGFLQPGNMGVVQAYVGYKFVLSNPEATLNITVTQNETFELKAQSSPFTPPVFNRVTLNDLVFQKVNEYRMSQGVPALTKNSVIQTLSEQHSQGMAQRYNGRMQLDHNGFRQRYNQAAAQISGVSTGAENVFAGNDASDEEIAREAVEGWKNSPGHNANILNPALTLSGLSVVKKNGTVYITQMFTTGR